MRTLAERTDEPNKVVEAEVKRPSAAYFSAHSLRIAILFIATMSANHFAHSQERSRISTGLSNGNYSKDATALQSAPKSFGIKLEGNRATLVDHVNQITYQLDLASRGEQWLPKEYIQFLRRKPETSAFANLVSGISISNVQTSSLSSEIAGTVKVYLKYSTGFGNISAILEAEGSVVTEECILYGIDEGRHFERYHGACVTANVGKNLRLARFWSSYPSYDRILGMILDFGLRVGSLGFNSQGTLYERR